MTLSSSQILEIKKVCKKCGIEKPLPQFHHRKSRGKDKRLIPRHSCRECLVKEKLKWYDKDKIKNPEKYYRYYRKWYLKKHYNLTISDYHNLLASHNGKCAICGNAPTKGRGLPFIDHCHATGKVRGILCSDCNTGLGAFKDNETSLRNAINYLLKSRMV